METIAHVNSGLFQKMTKDLPIAVLLLDMENDYLYSNVLFQELSGLNSSQARSKGWSQCLAPKHKQALFDKLTEIRDAGLKSSKKTLKSSLKGFNAATTITIIPVNDPDLGRIFLITFVPDANQASGYTVNNYDVDSNSPSIGKTGNSAVEDADVNAKIAELESSNQLKDKILSIISHDLRSPLASLKGLSSTFFDEALSSQERSSIKESLLAQLESVSDLTENLLRWASTSFWNKKPHDPVVLNLAEMVDQNTKLVSNHLKIKNISVSKDIPSGLTAFANKDHINIVIRNLINNAIKYTPPGGKIEISGVDLTTHVQLRIADTGIGLTSDQLCNLFTHSHSNTYGTNGEKGIGLGLLLCKEYLESNGGKIFVSSELNTGTTVIIELPIQELS